MIAYIKGKVLNKGRGYVIVVAQDIGYQVFVNPTMITEISVGQSVELYTHHHVREEALDLYGFRLPEELEMFEMLLSISGIGPKSALGVLAIATVPEIRETIAQGDSSLLTKVSGIGKKTAERIVLELREKVAALDAGRRQAGGVSASSDEIDALMALGYSLQQAREALKSVDAETKESGQRIKEALRNLGKN